MQTACICRKKKAGSSVAGFCSRNPRTADEWREIVEAVTLPDCKEDVENDAGIANVPSHNEAYGLGGTGILRSHSSTASP